MCSSKLSVNCEYADTWVRSIPAEEKILFVPAADAAISRAQVQRKTCRPDRVNCLRGSSAPVNRCREKTDV